MIPQPSRKRIKLSSSTLTTPKGEENTQTTTPTRPSLIRFPDKNALEIDGVTVVEEMVVHVTAGHRMFLVRFDKQGDTLFYLKVYNIGESIPVELAVYDILLRKGIRDTSFVVLNMPERFVALKKCACGDLFDYICKNNDNLPQRETTNVCRLAARELLIFHNETGMVHGDVKAENYLCLKDDKSEKVKALHLIDFEHADFPGNTSRPAAVGTGHRSASPGLPHHLIQLRGARTFSRWVS